MVHNPGLRASSVCVCVCVSKALLILQFPCDLERRICKILRTGTLWCAGAETSSLQARAVIVYYSSERSAIFSA